MFSQKMPVVWSLSIACLILFSPSAPAQPPYKTAQEAFNAGAKLHSARKYAECQEPFESALDLSQDNLFKVKVYRALMSSYRQLPEIDKMLEATDFIFEHGESTLDKTSVASSLAVFVRERGKIAEAVKIYEDQLKKTPRSKPALYFLTEIYQRAEPNPNRRAELLKVLSDVQKLDEAKLAEKFEGLARDQPANAAAHWKDAAAAWLRADKKPKATVAVKNAEAAGPDTRNDLLAHFWHKGMADIYLELEQPKQAIPHYENAIKKTTIAGYIKTCEEQLAKAKAMAM
jgi:tetratricopeptide (TPR) repeat protein